MNKLNVILLADNELTRRMGLMHTRPLEKNECALFCNHGSNKLSFWNKNVSYPISLIFCNDDGVVLDLGKLEAGQLNSVTSKKYARYVIEAHIDLPKILDIKVGTKLKLSSDHVEIE